MMLLSTGIIISSAETFIDSFERGSLVHLTGANLAALRLIPTANQFSEVRRESFGFTDAPWVVADHAIEGKQTHFLPLVCLDYRVHPVSGGIHLYPETILHMTNGFEGKVGVYEEGQEPLEKAPPPGFGAHKPLGNQPFVTYDFLKVSPC